MVDAGWDVFRVSHNFELALNAALAAAPSSTPPTPGTANELEAVARVVGMERAEQLLGGSLTRETL